MVNKCKKCSAKLMFDDEIKAQLCHNCMTIGAVIAEGEKKLVDMMTDIDNIEARIEEVEKKITQAQGMIDVLKAKRG